MASSRPQRSEAWDFFDKDGQKKVWYKLCPSPGTILAYHRGTTSMRSHLVKRYPQEFSSKTSTQKRMNVYLNSKGLLKFPSSLAVYCWCECEEFGRMIACDGAKCPIVWFHFPCVGLFHEPEGSWFCSQFCKNSIY